MARPGNPARDARIREMWAAGGVSKREIARRVSCDEATVRAVLDPRVAERRNAARRAWAKAHPERHAAAQRARRARVLTRRNWWLWAEGGDGSAWT